MTNRELQEELKKYPDSLQVIFIDNDFGDAWTVKGAELNNHPDTQDVILNIVCEV